MFVGRQRELQILEQEYARREGSFVPIYGRRRVGKSKLILHFIESRPALYYLGKQAPGGLQIAEFLREAAVALNEPLLSGYAATGWKDALTTVASRAPQARKLVLVLDEFQWMVEQSPELPSVLQELWDRTWAGSGRIMLILCGSFVGFMERDVLGQKSPLFGRRTAQILLKPFSYLEAAEFHPSWSLEHRATAYFICGGVPAYLKAFREDRSPNANIVTGLLDEFAPLFREPDFLLREELRDVAGYHAVLTALAAGNRTPKTVASHTALPERSVPYYVQQLVALGYVSRQSPLDGGMPSARKVRLAVHDPLLSFWFRFVFPNRTFIGHAGAARAFSERVKPELASYYGKCFEMLCREALPHLYGRDGITASFSIGEYWDKRVQLDVVGVRDDGCIDLGECKWGAVRSASALEAELNAKASLYPNRKNATLVHRFFTRKHPRGQKLANCCDLEELYSL